jgi:transposase
LTVVVDQDTGRLVSAAPGRDRRTVEAFRDALGQERCKSVELVSCDMAGWIAAPIAERLPGGVRCVDPFHVVKLATDALDEVRREVCNEARRAGQTRDRQGPEGCPLRAVEQPRGPHRPAIARLAEIQKTNEPLYRAYLIKEQFDRSTGSPQSSAIIAAA